MARVLERIFLTEDEGWNPKQAILDRIEASLSHVKFDTYNERYVVRVTIDTLDKEEIDNG